MGRDFRIDETEFPGRVVNAPDDLSPDDEATVLPSLSKTVFFPQRLLNGFPTPLSCLYFIAPQCSMMPLTASTGPGMGMAIPLISSLYLSGNSPMASRKSPRVSVGVGMWPYSLIVSASSRTACLIFVSQTSDAGSFIFSLLLFHPSRI